MPSSRKTDRKKAADFFSVESEDDSAYESFSEQESEDESKSKNETKQIKKLVFDINEDDNDDNDDDDEEEIDEDEKLSKSKSRPDKFSKFTEDDSDDFDYEEIDEENDDTTTTKEIDTTNDIPDKKDSDDEKDNKKTQKQKKLLKNAKDAAKRAKKSGLIYISRVPEMMTPGGMRQILERFGEVDRLYLVPYETTQEDQQQKSDNDQQKKKKKGKKPRLYKEGWAEFVRKKDAKLCAGILDGRTTLGGKNRRSRFYDTVVAVRYLKGFKWNDLAEQMVAEKEAYTMKLKKEIALGNEESRVFAESIAIAKSLSKKRGHEEDGDNDEGAYGERKKVSRNFSQRASVSRRAGESDEFKNRKTEELAMNNVLSNIF